jgi:CheY-like chemotaxis protein/anti-sigma regulatory factor (Ser/Thr protein kinase)
VRLDQIVCNLLINAVKYTPPGGTIRVITVRVGDESRVLVTDDGAGMSPDLAERAFDLFVQGERDLDRSQGGLGIGLTLVKRLVELHGGTVTAQSEGPGAGSAFVIRLPISDEAQLFGAGTRGGAVLSTASSLRILIVDDNRDAADGLAILLHNYGSETRTAYDGLEALRVAADFRPDVVLLDIGMPKADGREVARRLRREPWGARTYVIAVTGWSNETDRASSKEAGFDHHLVKPLDTAELTRLLAPLEEAARSRGKS